VSKEPRVDLKRKLVSLHGTGYSWEYDQYGEKRFWSGPSKKYVIDEDSGERVRVEDLGDIDLELEGFSTAWVRVNDPRVIKILDKAVRRARARRHREREQKRRRAKHRDPVPANAETAEAEPTEQDQGVKTTQGTKTTVNARLRSEVSDYELNFRAAPSKKNAALCNFSVHLGSKLLGYVEIKREAIVQFGRDLQQLG